MNWKVKIKAKWSEIIGSSRQSQLEYQFFNIISIIACLTLLVIAIINFSIELYSLGIVYIVMSIIAAFLYWLSRYKNKFKLASIGFIIVSYILMCYNYYMNSGINGPTIYIFFLSFIFTYIISPKKYNPLWITLHLIIVPLLFFSEAKYPHWILVDYNSDLLRYIDIYLSYVTAIFVFYIAINFISKAYYREKKTCRYYQ